MMVEPDEFETGEEGELVEDPADQAGDELDIEDVPTLIERPRRHTSVTSSQQAELFLLQAHLRQPSPTR